METRVINMSSKSHKVVLDVLTMANQEGRSIANMTSVLLYEALDARNKANEQARHNRMDDD
jgi:hypothetical protein